MDEKNVTLTINPPLWHKPLLSIQETAIFFQLAKTKFVNYVNLSILRVLFYETEIEC